MVRLISLAVLLTLIVFLGITFYQVIAPFLLPLLLAGILAVLCQPLFHFFRRHTKGRTRLAAGFTTTAVLTAVLIPLGFGIIVAASQLQLLATNKVTADDLQAFVESTRLKVNRVLVQAQKFLPENSLPQELPAGIDDEVRSTVPDMLTALSDRSLGIAGKTINKTIQLLGSMVSGLISVLMFVVALYYFLADGPALLAAAEKLIPVHVDYQQQLVRQFDKVVRAVILATLLAALGQGFATASALYLVGQAVETVNQSDRESVEQSQEAAAETQTLPDPFDPPDPPELLSHFFLLLILSTVASLVPLAGTWLVWIPCVIWLFYHGYWVLGVLLTLFGTVVIGLMDNFIRTYVLHSDAKLHPLLAFVSVFGGLQAMGLWGVFVGPIVASCLHALVQIFNTELKEFSKEKFSQTVSRIAAEESESVPESLADAESPQSIQQSAPTTDAKSIVDQVDEDVKKSPPNDGRPASPQSEKRGQQSNS